MKKITIALLMAFACLSNSAWAQPAKFNYQGVARNATGGALANQNLGVRISLINGTPGGTNVYTETHTATTNAYGLYVLAIGGGTVVSGDMNTIDWANGDKFVKVEIDPAGGASYADMGTTQLLSVPYAAYAKNAGNAKLVIPYSDTTTNASTLFSLENNGDGTAIEGLNNSTTSNVAAVRGMITSTAPGGFSSAVRGINNGTGGLGIGVWGSQAGSGWGVHGTTPAGYGVYGTSSGGGVGVYANSTSGIGLSASSSTGKAATVDIFNNANTSDALTVSTNGAGKGVQVSSAAGIGMQVASNNASAAFFTNTNNSNAATTARINTTGTGSAISAQISSASNNSAAAQVITSGLGNGISVQLTNASNGARGIDVSHAGNGPGVLASTAGNAIWGITTSTSSAGVIGDNATGEAVVGRTSGAGGVGAVVGRSDGAGYGVRGFNTKAGIGVLGQAGISAGTGVAGRFENVNSANTSDAMQVVTNGTGNGISVTAVTGGSTKGAVYATASAASGNGVIGEANGATGYGVWGKSTSGYAGYFSGRLHVAGTLSKSAGTFKIDHPQDPANKYLVHSFVESPDMMNVYNGNVTTGANGSAVVELPAYFEAENIDFKYQLTVIGQFAQAIVAEEISNNKFIVKTDKPNVKVSWQITGVRNDRFAQRNRVVAEVEKAPEERGFYLNPEVYDMPESRAISANRGGGVVQTGDDRPVPQTVEAPANLPSSSSAATRNGDNK